MYTCDLKLDWLSFTYKSSTEDLERMGLSYTSIDAFMDAFPELSDIWCDSSTVCGTGWYNECIVYNNNIRFSFNTDVSPFITSGKDMGVNVSIPSHSLEWFFALFDLDVNDSQSICILFKLLLDRNCKCSRIDLCFDDYEKKYTPEFYSQCWYDGSLVSKFKKARMISSRHGYGGTFYLGDRKCNKLMRIYDKNYESNGAKDCIRYEFEVHSNNAKDMQLYFIDNSSLDFFGYLLSWFRIVDLNSNNNISRTSIDTEWFDYFTNLIKESVFCEDFKKLKVTIPKYSKSEREAMVSHWLETYCMREISSYVQVFGWDRLFSQVRRFKGEISPKYRQFAH